MIQLFERTVDTIKLADGIDPAQWASLCRFIGNKSPREFDAIVKMVKGRKDLGVVPVRQKKGVRMPLVSIGPCGSGRDILNLDLQKLSCYYYEVK